MMGSRTTLAMLALVGTIGCASEDVPAYVDGESLKTLYLEKGQGLDVLAHECGVGAVRDALMPSSRPVDYHAFLESIMDLNPKQFRGASPLPGRYKVPARLCLGEPQTDY